MAYCATALLRRRTETPGDTVTDHPPAEADAAAAWSRASSMFDPVFVEGRGSARLLPNGWITAGQEREYEDKQSSQGLPPSTSAGTRLASFRSIVFARFCELTHSAQAQSSLDCSHDERVETRRSW